jgi:hypothetical protein
MKFLHFFLLLWVIFALLDPDPFSEYGSGYTDLIEFGSNTDPEPCPPPPQHSIHLPDKGFDEAVDGEKDLIRVLFRPTLRNREDRSVHIARVGHDLMMPAIVVHVVVTPSATVVVIVVERKVTTTSYHCMTPNSSSTG